MPSGMSKRKQSSFGSLDLRACYEYMINQRLSLRCSNRDKNYLVVSYKICMYDTPQYETRARRPFSLLTVPKCIQNVIHPPPVLITVYNVVNKTKKKKRKKKEKKRKGKKRNDRNLEQYLYRSSTAGCKPFPIIHAENRLNPFDSVVVLFSHGPIARQSCAYSRGVALLETFLRDVSNPPPCDFFLPSFSFPPSSKDGFQRATTDSFFQFTSH